MVNFREKLKTLFQKIKLIHLFSPITIILFLILIILLLGVGGFGYNQFFSNNKKVVDNYLNVVLFSPGGIIYNPVQPITITFNYSVIAHHVQDFIEINPAIEGRFEQVTPRQIIFRPSKPYPSGLVIMVRLKAGLPSDVGKKLLYDQSYSFQYGTNDKPLTFSSNNQAAKFMSFQADKGASMTLQSKTNLKNPILRIYKVTPKVLLESLIYNAKSNSYNNILYGEYQEKVVDTTSLELVEERKLTDPDQKIEFKNKAGLYYFEAKNEDKVLNSVWVSINKIGIHFRQDDQKVYLAAQDLISGEAQGGMDIGFYTLNDKPKLVAKHTLGNIQEYPFVYPDRIDLIIAQKEDDVMVIPVAIPNSQAEIRVYQDLNSVHKIFIYTDRPIYKKGDKVAFRGIARVDNDGLYKEASASTKIRVYIPRYGSNKPNIEQVVETSNGGKFSGELTLPKDFSKETVYLYASTALIDNGYSSSNGYTYFDVAEYIKPEYGLEITSDKNEYIKGDKIKANIKGSYFNGKPMVNDFVTYTVYKRDFYETEKAVYNKSFKLNNWGGMCGGGFGTGDEYYGIKIGESQNINLDSSGRAYVEFDTATINDDISQEVTLVVEKYDKNQNKIVSASIGVVHGGEFNIFFLPGTTNIVSGENFTKQFYAESLSGTKISNQQLAYSLYEQEYQPQSATSTKKIIKSGQVTTDGAGVGTLTTSHTTSNSGTQIYLEISSPDSRKNNIQARQYLFIYQPQTYQQSFLQYGQDSQTILQITSKVKNLVPGTKANLTIHSPSDLNVFTTFERGRVYLPQWLQIKKGDNQFEFDVADNFMPSITPTFSFFYNGHYYIEGLSLNVPAMKKLITVDVSMDKQKYAPNDTALLTIITKDASGNLVSADVGLAVVDKAIFALRKNATSPIHSSFYYFRARATNASSSLTWIANGGTGGGGGGGGGGELFSKDVDTLYWNPNLRTGSDGRVTVPIPVGFSQTTWRGITYVSTSDSKFGQGEIDFLVAK